MQDLHELGGHYMKLISATHDRLLGKSRNSYWVQASESKASCHLPLFTKNLDVNSQSNLWLDHRHGLLRVGPTG